MRELGELGVGATLSGVGNGPRLTQLTLELHDYDDLDRLRRSAEKIAFALGLGEDAVGVALASGERLVHVTLPRAPSSWRSVSWGDLRGELQSTAARELALPICVGTDVLGAPFLIDLAAAPHLLIGGTTGSGKSMCLHALLLSILEGPSGRTDLVLIDPKEVEFTAYEKCAWLRTEVVRATEEAFRVLEELVVEMDARQESFRTLGVRDFQEARAKGADLNRIVVVIDELGDLLLQRREIETSLIRLAQKARSSGIHLVLATQRPEAATFSGMLRSNVPSRIALTVQKATESRIILDEAGAEALLMKGDMLVKMSGDTVRRAHGCRVELADILAGVALA
jgi:S-DNA-T family DNA segregation ATPase FtsK/SpoIIIE